MPAASEHERMASQDRFGFARMLIVDASRLALQFCERRSSLLVTSKQALDIVTDADRGVERFIRARVREHFPDDGFVGEESDREQSRNG